MGWSESTAGSSHQGLDNLRSRAGSRRVSEASSTLRASAAYILDPRCLSCLTPVPIMLLSPLYPATRQILCPSFVPTPARPAPPPRVPFSLRVKAKDLPVPCEALQDLASIACLPSSPGGPLTSPPQAHPTPGHLHFHCPLPGILFPQICPWLPPSLPSDLCLSTIPSLATCSQIPTLHHPRPFLFLSPALFFSA